MGMREKTMDEGAPLRGGCGDREWGCAVGGRTRRVVGAPCAVAPLRRRNGCGGGAAEGRIVSKPPVTVDETAETGCAFVTRQRLLRSRSIVARKSEPVLPSGRCGRPTLRAKTRCAEGSTAVEAPSAARPACDPA